MRVFTHSTAIKRADSAILGWYWTKHVGLRAIYKDGIDTSSEYTLAELLDTEKRPEGYLQELKGSDLAEWWKTARERKAEFRRITA
jgi:hypothetical protein